MPNAPKHPGRRYAIQAAIGLTLIVTAGLAVIIRNHLAQNPVHWLVGGAGALGSVILLWRYRGNAFVGALINVLQHFFRRKGQNSSDNETGEDPFDFDPSDFGGDQPGPSGNPSQKSGAQGNGKGASTSSSNVVAGTKHKPKKQPTGTTLHIGMVRKLEDLRDDPKTPETERQNAISLLEKHVKSLKRRKGKK